MLNSNLTNKKKKNKIDDNINTDSELSSEPKPGGWPATTFILTSFPNTVQNQNQSITNWSDKRSPNQEFYESENLLLLIFYFFGSISYDLI